MGDAFDWGCGTKTAQAKKHFTRAHTHRKRILEFPDSAQGYAQYVREDGQTQSERELLALLRWARRNNKASTAKRAGERGYPELQEALRTVKALFKEFND